MLAQALPRSLILVGMCHSSGFQALGVCRVLSVGEKCLGNCGFGGEGSAGMCSWLSHSCFNQNSSGNEDCYRKVSADLPFYEIYFNLFFKFMFMHLYFSCSLIDPFCDGKACFS